MNVHLGLRHRLLRLHLHEISMRVTRPLTTIAGFSQTLFEIGGMTGTASGKIVGVTRAASGDAARRKALFESLVDNSPAPIFMKDQEGKYLLVNNAYSHLVGRAPDEILEHTDFDLFPEIVAEAYRHNDLLVMLRASSIQTKEPFIKDEVEQTLTVMKFPIIGERGEVLGVCGISVDPTETVQGADAQRAERRRLVDAAAFNRLVESLTPQEGRVLELLVQGLSDSEIAEALHLESDTVRHHVSHLLKKLRKRSRTQAVIEMLRYHKGD